MVSQWTGKPLFSSSLNHQKDLSRRQRKWMGHYIGLHLCNVRNIFKTGITQDYWEVILPGSDLHTECLGPLLPD